MEPTIQITYECPACFREQDNAAAANRCCGADPLTFYYCPVCDGEFDNRHAARECCKARGS